MGHITDEEREIIRKHYPTMERTQLQVLLPKRSWNGIRSEARRMKLRRQANPVQRWRSDEDRGLQERMSAGACLTDVVAVPIRGNQIAIADRAEERCLAQAEPGEPNTRITSHDLPTGWSTGEFLVLLDSYPSPDVSIRDIMHRLPGKSLPQIRRAARLAGLGRPRSTMATAVAGRDAKNVWRNAEDMLVLRMWKSATPEEIRCFLPHRTEGAIAQRARKLLRRERSEKATAPSGNVAVAAE
jgi:hypothetical protein